MIRLVLCVLFLVGSVAVAQDCPNGVCPQSIRVTRLVPMAVEYAPVRTTIDTTAKVAVRAVKTVAPRRVVSYQTKTVYQPKTYVRRTVTRRGLWFRAR